MTTRQGGECRVLKLGGSSTPGGSGKGSPVKSAPPIRVTVQKRQLDSAGRLPVSPDLDFEFVGL